MDYGRRPEGSESKLSTFKDGAKILFMFARLMKETQPMRFFGLIGGALFGLSAIFMSVPLVEFFMTGLVTHMPTWVGSIGLLLLATLSLVAGFILQSVAAGRAENKRLIYLNQPPRRGEMRPATKAYDDLSMVDAPGITPLMEELLTKPKATAKNKK